MNTRLGFLLFGFVFWVIGVIAIRFLGPIMFDGGLLHVLIFVIAFLSAPPTILIVAKLAGRAKSDMLLPAATMSLTAMLFDGLAVTFDALGVTHIYADTALLSAYAGGLLLFAFWSIILFAVIWHRD